MLRPVPALFIASSLLALAAGLSAQQQEAPPSWAYTINTPLPPGAPAPPARDAYSPPDANPSAHPPMPASVGQGRKPDMIPCGFCHYPTGFGRPENSSLAGQPAGYIIQQTKDFKTGDRQSSEPKMRPPQAMINVAKAVTDAELREAAEYFAKIPYTKWIRVVEADTVAKMRVAGGVHVPIVGEGEGTEPLGNRIIETPEDVKKAEERDTTSGFVAYVPKGSIEKGKAIAADCTACHSDDLRGMGEVPGLAGRSPSYTVRQLFDFKSGARNGQNGYQMKDIAKSMSLDEMIQFAAYAASLDPAVGRK